MWKRKHKYEYVVIGAILLLFFFVIYRTIYRLPSGFSFDDLVLKIISIILLLGGIYSVFYGFTTYTVETTEVCPQCGKKSIVLLTKREPNERDIEETIAGEDYYRYHDVTRKECKNCGWIGAIISED